MEHHPKITPSENRGRQLMSGCEGQGATGQAGGGVGEGQVSTGGQIGGGVGGGQLGTGGQIGGGAGEGQVGTGGQGGGGGGGV